MPKNDMHMMMKVNIDILAERVEQNKKWGVQQHSMAEWLVILIEEIGEVAQAMQKKSFSSKETDADNLYEELIQVAAVASAIAEQVNERGY